MADHINRLLSDQFRVHSGPCCSLFWENLSLLLTRKVVHHRSTNKRHPAAVISMLTNRLLRKDRGLPSLTCSELTCVAAVAWKARKASVVLGDPTVVSRSPPPQPSAAALGKSQRQQLSWEGKDWHHCHSSYLRLEPLGGARNLNTLVPRGGQAAGMHIASRPNGPTHPTHTETRQTDLVQCQ